MKKTIIIGLGNPILTDDSVGIKVVRLLKDRLNSLNGSNGLNCSVDVIELYAGGIRLIDVLAGYDHALIVDAMVTGDHDYGTVRFFAESELRNTRNTISMHDIDLPTALEMGRMLGIKMPWDITVLGIEAKDVETFSEDLTAEVAKAVPAAVAKIINDLSNNLPVRGQL